VVSRLCFASFLGAFWFLFLWFCSALKISLNASGMGQGGKRKKKNGKAGRERDNSDFEAMLITFLNQPDCELPETRLEPF
jgi:hypothetical protein